MQRKRRLRKVDSAQDFQAQEYDSVQYAISDDIVAYMRLIAAIAVLSDETRVKLPRPIISQGSIGSKIWNEDGGYWDLDEESEKVSLTDLKTLILPEGIVIKGGTTESLFGGCENLDYVELSHDFSEIGKNMFYGCSSLTSITIPNSVTYIGDYAFEGTSLSSVVIGSGLTNVGESIFGEGGNSSIRSVMLRDGLSTIPREMFEGCSSLTSITIPNSVTSIGSYAFRGCSALSSITIPDSVSNIEHSVFQGCSYLTSITIPDSVTYIGNYAFDDTNLSSVTIGSGLTRIGAGIFGDDGNSSIRSVTLREGLSTIPEKMFLGCESLTSITIPDSVMSIGDSAFAFCSSLTSVTIPNSVMSIGSEAFSDCESLTSITIPDSVKSIGSGAFYYSGISSITIGSGVTTIGSRAFLECYSLHTIIVMSTHEINLKNALGEYENMGPYTIYVPSSKVDYYTNHFDDVDWEDVTIRPISEI